MASVNFKRTLTIIVLIGVALRLALAWRFYGTTDVGAWEKLSVYWQQHRSPYDANYIYNYSPIWFWVISLMSWIARGLSLPFTFVIKWPLVLADLAVLWLFTRACPRMGYSPRKTLAVCAAFFLNPVSILLSGIHGQFDILSLFFILLGWFSYEFIKRESAGSLAGLTLGVAVKHFNLLMIPLFAFAQKKPVRKAFYFIVPPMVFCALLAPYFVTSAPYVLKNVFGHHLSSGYWGWSGVICRGTLLLTGRDLTVEPWFVIIDRFNPMLYISMMVAGYFLIKKFDLLDAIIVQFLIFYSFTTQIGPQYSLWIIPFAALRPSKFFYLYTAAAGAQIAVFLYCHHHWAQAIPFTAGIASHASEIFVILRYATWVVCVVWLWKMLTAKSPLFFCVSRDQYVKELEHEIVGSCETLLDVGCGGASPIAAFSGKLRRAVGVDAFEPYLEQSRRAGIYHDYQLMEAMDIGVHFEERSFDVVVLSDVVEHGSKEDGGKLIAAAERIARKKVLIFTPNGFLPQAEIHGNAYQRHLSGWSVKEMRERGYRVIGINGWKPLRTEFARIAWWPGFFWARVSLLTQPLVRCHPDHAFQILCIKDIP